MADASSRECNAKTSPACAVTCGGEDGGEWPRSIESEEQAALCVENHGGEQQRQVKDGDLEEVAGEAAGLRRKGCAKDTGEADGVPEIAEVQ